MRATPTLHWRFRKLGYDPALVGYTDTTPDPRLHIHPKIRCSKPTKAFFQGLTGFWRCPAENFPEPWALWLEERGYEVPKNLRDLYYASVTGYPGVESRGKTYAPAPYSKEESETAFVTDKADKIHSQAGLPGHGSFTSVT